MIMVIGTVISNIVQGLFRSIKSSTIGQNRATADYVSPGMIDFSPVVGMKAIYSNTSNSREPIVIGYINKTIINDLQEGESAFFSTNGQTSLGIIKARSNGDIEINGDADFAVRFSELESGYNELRTDFNNLVTQYNLHVHPGVLTGGSSSLVTTQQGQSSSASITAAKVDNVKLP